MNYATTYQGYNNNTATAAEAKTIAPPVERIYRPDGTAKGRKRNPKGQTKARTDKHVADAILRTSFLPRLQEAETIEACGDTERMERDFYQSLSHLAQHYAIEPMQTQHYGYPYNIALALEDVKVQLQNKIENWHEVRLIHHQGSTFFAKEERYDTGATLYYIPVVPLYHMLKDTKRKHASLLLLSVCSYLYNIADIPYYRRQCSYLYYMYQMLMEMKAEDEEEDTDPIFFAQYREAEYLGDIIERKLRSPYNLKWFRYRLDTFRGRDNFDKGCLHLAAQFFELYEEHSNTPISCKFRPARNDEELEQVDGYRLSLENYISFFASADGALSESLIETVNSDLQEYTMIDEPTLYRPFDGRKLEEDNFDFEQRLFSLIEELTTLLNEYQTTKL